MTGHEGALLKGRFLGPDGRRRLLDVLQGSSLVAGERDLAESLADIGRLEEFARGQPLILEDAADNDLFLLLAGEVSILVRGREQARRTSGQHVGEMTLIDPRARRSATVVPREVTIALRIEEPAFANVAERKPELWRRLAIELGSRLRQRNVHVRARNELPILFIGSSKEALEIAQAIQIGLDHDRVLVRIWSDGVFGATRTALEDLIRQVDEADFAVLLLSPDDQVVSRDTTAYGPRDNVVFELGMFMAVLGRERTLMVGARKVDLKLPTDLLGLTPLTYDSARLPDKAAALAPVCTVLRGTVERLGPR